MGALVRYMETMKMVYWVNVSESSGGSPGCCCVVTVS